MPFDFEKQDIPDVILIKPKVFYDDRGFFMETYSKKMFRKENIDTTWVQFNQSRSKKNVLRGLHFQKHPYAQAKLVRCIKGEIFDVVVDLRKKSPTYGEWVSAILSEENKYSLYIPRGFAHGFAVLSDYADVIYAVDNAYAPKYESGILWNDPDLNITWPIKNPILSEKDKTWPQLVDL